MSAIVDPAREGMTGWISAATAATPGAVPGRSRAAPGTIPDVEEAADEALCARVGLGDEQAFDVLVGRYQGRAYRLAWSILRDAEDARDVSQEAFVTLYRSASTFRGRSRFRRGSIGFSSISVSTIVAAAAGGAVSSTATQVRTRDHRSRSARRRPRPTPSATSTRRG